MTQEHRWWSYRLENKKEIRLSDEYYWLSFYKTQQNDYNVVIYDNATKIPFNVDPYTLKCIKFYFANIILPIYAWEINFKREVLKTRIFANMIKKVTDKELMRNTIIFCIKNRHIAADKHRLNLEHDLPF